MKIVNFTEWHLVYLETNQLVNHEASLQLFKKPLSLPGNQLVYPKTFYFFTGNMLVFQETS